VELVERAGIVVAGIEGRCAGPDFERADGGEVVGGADLARFSAEGAQHARVHGERPLQREHADLVHLGASVASVSGA